MSCINTETFRTIAVDQKKILRISMDQKSQYSYDDLVLSDELIYTMKVNTSYDNPISSDELPYILSIN